MFWKSGRGTARSVLLLSQSDGTSVSCLLTAAHVAFSDLSPEFLTDNSRHQIVERLMSKSVNIGYVREEMRCLDYALLPCQPEFVNWNLNSRESQPNPPFRLLPHKFIGSAKDILTAWSHVKHLVPEGRVRVIKRGITTNETVGEMYQISKSNVIDIIGESYSDVGDNGALVCMVSDEDQLVPIGVHFQGCN